MIDCQVRLSCLKPGQRIRNLHTHWTGRVYAQRCCPGKPGRVHKGAVPIRTVNRSGRVKYTHWRADLCMVIVRLK
jgi:hypothetical protein